MVLSRSTWTKRYCFIGYIRDSKLAATRANLGESFPANQVISPWTFILRGSLRIFLFGESQIFTLTNFGLFWNSGKYKVLFEILVFINHPFENLTKYVIESTPNFWCQCNDRVSFHSYLNPTLYPLKRKFLILRLAGVILHYHNTIYIYPDSTSVILKIQLCAL